MMLLAPKSGKDTRKTIQKGTRQLRDRTVGGVMGAFKQVTSRGNDLKDGVMERADGLQKHSRNIIAHELDNVAEAAKRARKAVKA
jgi:gas vesicle protein